MQCEVKSISEEAEGISNLDNLPPQGFVQQVCQEWVVHEDSALAHRLQEQENETHYGQNRNVRRVIREDIQQARVVQQEEEEEALQLQVMYENMLLKQEQADEEIARQLQEQESAELQLKQHSREADEDYARQVQEKERKKLDSKKRDKDKLKEIGQTEKLRMQYVPKKETEVVQRKNLEKEFPSVTPAADLDDLSDFCLQPTPDMDETSIRRLQEEQDAELARLMQEQETKRSGYSEKDHIMAVEAQDHELASLLQDQEKARARRMKERAKKKALLKQQSEQLMNEEIQPYACSSIVDPRKNSNSRELLSSLSRTTAVQSGESEIPLVPESNNGSENPEDSQERLLTSERYSDVQELGFSKDNHDKTNESSVKSHSNVAMAIDPTYLHKQSGISSNISVEKIRSGGSTPVLPSPASLRAGAYQGHEDEYYDSDESLAPPYMPIQGQKRTSSLEKKRKGKSGKDGCKQQ